MSYKVTNVYGISGDSNHRSFKGAVEARDRREGDGWVIYDTARGSCVEPHPQPIAGGGWDIIPEEVD